MLKQQNSQEYPSNLGKRWTDDEDNALIEEFGKNTDVITMAENHMRTIGSIVARQQTLAYKLHLQGDCAGDIAQKLKLDEQHVVEIIRVAEYNQSQRKKIMEIKKVASESKKAAEIAEQPNKTTNKRNNTSRITELENEVDRLKNEIAEIRKIICGGA